MRTGTKLLVVFLGLVAAAVIASAVVAIRVAMTSGPDRETYAAMYDFADSILFLAVFAVVAIPAIGAALYFLRPWRPLWVMLSVAAVFCGATSLAAALSYAMRIPPVWAPLRLFTVPATGSVFLMSGIFAPTRSARILFLATTALDVGALAYVVLFWFHGFRF